MSREIEVEGNRFYVGALHGSTDIFINHSGSLCIGTEAPPSGYPLKPSEYTRFTITPAETARFAEWLTGRPEFQNSIKEYKDDLEYENEGNVDV